jgi:hypothetical protein
MQKVKEMVRKFQEPIDDHETEERLRQEREKYIDDNLKPEINALLHQYLPQHITVGQMETLATVINLMILQPEEFLKG